MLYLSFKTIINGLHKDREVPRNAHQHLHKPLGNIKPRHMATNDRLLKTGFGLKITGISILIALIFGFISFSNDDKITTSGFYLIWPILIGIATLILFLLTRLINKQIGFGVLILFSLINVLLNLILLII
jgi:uncharacterized membrane protein